MVVKTADQDGPMDGGLCQSIELFLRDRGRLRGLKANVEHYHELFEDAVDFMEEEKEGRENANTSIMPSVSPWSLISPTATSNAVFVGGNYPYGSSSFLLGGSQQSPFVPMLSNRMYPHSLLSTTSNYEALGTGHNATSPNAFGLVAGILHAKYSHAVNTLLEDDNPFDQLIRETARRIERLEELANRRSGKDDVPLEIPAATSKMAKNEVEGSTGDRRSDLSLQFEAKSNGSGRNVEEDDEWRERIETKLRLWKLLHSDLVE